MFFIYPKVLSVNYFLCNYNMSIVVHKLPGGMFTEKRIKEVTLFFCQIFDKLIYKLLCSGTIRSHSERKRIFIANIYEKRSIFMHKGGHIHG